MGWVKIVFGLLFTIIVIVLLVFYWFVPTEIFVYNIEEPNNYNFTLENLESAEIQFYPNMRFPDKNISYKISDKCTLKKKNDAEFALEILENKTILNFYNVSADEEISVECEEKIKINEDFFVAGRGRSCENNKNR